MVSWVSGFTGSAQQKCDLTQLAAAHRYHPFLIILISGKRDIKSICSCARSRAPRRVSKGFANSPARVAMRYHVASSSSNLAPTQGS
jgi:hypothetical protein